MTSALIPGLDVSRETRARLAAFVAELTRWSARINLVAKSDTHRIWDRHIRDSAQLFKLADLPCRHWVDIGSGGGLPGLVIAILALEHDPDRQVTLIESDQRKAAFLRHAVHFLDLKATVHAVRAEDLGPLNAAVVSARALGSLSKLLPLAHRHLDADGLAIFPKGADTAAEIAMAQQIWSFAMSEQQSITSPDACVLRLSSIKRITYA